MMNRLSRWSALLALVLPMVAATPAPSAAHEVPAHVTVLAFVRPDDGVLRILVRVPLESLRDVELPLRGPGYLVLDALEPRVRDAVRLWIVDYLEVRADERTLTDAHVAALRIALPSDRSFESYASALAGVRAPPLPVGTELPWQQALVDVLLEYPGVPDGARIALRPSLAHLGVRTATVLRFVPPDGEERVLRYEGDPGLVRLDPRWHQAFLNFAGLGFRHILEGLDHLLFLLCLIIPIRRMRPLIAIVTAFTVAHSITLAASALGFAPGALWFPPLIETLIALSIVWMAFENIVVASAREGESAAATRLERRWRIAFVFGLVHGFGFSFLLRDSLQFAGSHLAASLLAFNVGVEVGQVLVIAIAAPALALLFRHAVPERIGAILLSALVAHSAWHWMTARGAELVAYSFTWPALDAALALAVMRGALLVMIAVGAAWGLGGILGAWARAGARDNRPARAEP